MTLVPGPCEHGLPFNFPCERCMLKWRGITQTNDELAETKRQLELYKQAVNEIDDKIEHPEFWGMTPTSMRDGIYEILDRLARGLIEPSVRKLLKPSPWEKKT